MTRTTTGRARKAATFSAIVVVSLVVGLGVGLQINRYLLEPWGQSATPAQRQALFELLRPVALRNCQLERFGEARDGGYLMCANLLDGIEAGYSYGISGYDQWGCDIATRQAVIVHQYDCFDPTRPSCPTGRTIFHDECVGPTTTTPDGRRFDTLNHQVAANGDASKRIALKIDVEGAEWDTLLSVPDEVLAHVDQLVVEFHWFETDTSIAVVERLRRHFEVVHVHFNNSACLSSVAPFPSGAYEVTFVNKALAIVDTDGEADWVHPLDSPNYPFVLDCQP